jgi:hypothetical protein
VDDGHGVVVVTDMYGGSPSNLSLRACRPSNRRILTGVNLPMMIKLAKSRHLTVERPSPAPKKPADVHQFLRRRPGMSDNAVTVTRTFEIVNVKGLHARAAARFVEVVEAHDATATVRRDGLSAAGDSHHGAFDVGSVHGNHY